MNNNVEFKPAIETAKIVRQQLIQKFPSAKFKVVTKKYKDGACLLVTWEDGPIVEKVKAAIAQFQARKNYGSDGRITRLPSIWEGCEVSWEPDHISYERYYSLETYAKVAQELAPKYNAKVPSITLLNHRNKKGEVVPGRPTIGKVDWVLPDGKEESASFLIYSELITRDF